ncbi:hypothetical protein NE619_07595 [Anaerovorax odorimutans]|uniref:DUF3592 domain-containing protein n=1 Tax=Anaerovorax odorimutans TaxID=109327 RepID=A0ABT1RN22_9FIRM|nr:hypothetical protein [Anaerovorax odorimutans]MCQ4636589.1 hypothetical protein [Anaerovorax odorimutans]
MGDSIAIPFVISLVVVAALVALELRLSTRKSRWAGLIPIAVVAAVVVFANLALNMTAGAYKTVTRTVEDDNGNQYEIAFRYHKDGELMDFSDLRIKDQNGELMDKVYLSFEQDGRLEIDSDRILYQQIVDRLLDGEKLTGSSSEEEIEKNMVPLGGGLFVSAGSFWFREILWAIVPMIPVYVIGRLIVHSKRRKDEMKKLRLESL